MFAEKFSGAGGMPVGTGGKATLLLSGGIDSPVAGWMVAKRGVKNRGGILPQSAVYERARQGKGRRPCEDIIGIRRARIKLHVVPFTDIQLSIIENCPKEYLTIIMRRLMMRIAEKFARQNGSLALITGESVGQVASQDDGESLLHRLRGEYAGIQTLYRNGQGGDRPDLKEDRRVRDIYPARTRTAVRYSFQGIPRPNPRSER